MVTSASYRISSGLGIRRRPATAGRGILRNIASVGVRTVGNFIANKLADAIRGSGSYRITGKGRKPRATRRAPRKSLSGCGQKRKSHKVGRPRKSTTTRRARKPRKSLGGMRKRRVCRR